MTAAPGAAAPGAARVRTGGVRTGAVPVPGRVPPGTGPQPLGCPAGVRAVIGPAVLGGAIAAAGLAAVLRIADPAVLARAGPILLLVAAAVGLPHGALDPDLLPRATGSGPARPRAVALAAYAGVAAAAYALWWRWPGVGMGTLLTVAAAHFAAADLTASRWRRPDEAPPVRRWTCLRAASTGIIAVAGPFAWWPHLTSPVLRGLHAGPGAAAALTGAGRAALAAAVLTGAAAAAAAWRAGDRVGALEPPVLIALTGLCPPLVGFAVYFSCWHALRQTARLLAVHPDAARALRTAGVGAAAARLARRAVLPTLTAGLLLVVLGLTATRSGGTPATVLAGLLAVSAPHALADAWREHRKPPGP